MNDPAIGAAERYAKIAESLLEAPGVWRSTKKGFGSSGLMVGGKLFAAGRKDGLLLKLPRSRVDALIASGAGERFDPGHGREMKEWVTVKPGEDWLALANEALKFMAAKAR